MQPVGLQAEQAGWTAEDTVVTLTGSVAGLPVHNRRLTLDFSAGDGSVSLVGLWSFGHGRTPPRTASALPVAQQMLCCSLPQKAAKPVRLSR